ncbi:fungal-specific transcription factor domain-containing protein [Coniochaeta sp. 2T2.1]|nr:fungal-specific transcription factor domain-containing protein [Coniochaeta sp. 2T2.1]
MPLGPFDARNKRSRCFACASSHLKCDGGQPCNHCQRRDRQCVYQAGKSIINLDQARVRTSTNFQVTRGVLTTKHSSPSPPLRCPILYRQLYYFDVFVQRNTFVASTASYDTDIKKLLGTESGSYLTHAVTALGALQSSKLNSSTRKEDSYTALQAYSSSVIALQETMTHSNSPSRLHVLWTTLFLGLFELMHNESGEGWLMHMVHGTANALEASGPSACRSGPGRSFFLQARIFEVSRALLLGEPTFLSDPEWRGLSKSLEVEDVASCAVTLDRLLNIIVECSRLRFLTSDLLDRAKHSGFKPLRPEALHLATEGFRLRLALDSWVSSPTADLHHPDDPSRKTSTSPEEATLSNIFFAAVSIYLSGIFDYEIAHWQQRWEMPVPTISEDRVQEHLRSILTLVERQHTNLSPLLFLFPLRIAGARSCRLWQRERVMVLLARVGCSFAVAETFRMELREVWRVRDLGLGMLLVDAKD